MAETSMTDCNEELSGKEKAKLILPDGRILELPVFHPSLGSEILVDVRNLHSEAKVLTFDPGFNSTAACRSAITYIDGDAGVCLYRGHAVHELVGNIDYLDVCYLLLYGNLPGLRSSEAFISEVKSEMLVHEQLKVFVQGFIYGSHPMSILASVVSAMASFYADPMKGDHIAKQEERELACIRLIAKMPMIVAMIFKQKMGEPIVYPKSHLSYSENILNMMFGTPMEPYEIDPVKAKIIDAFLIIHADHEQNASTSTVRTAGSSLANPYACIASGITSLWGRAHGGANEAVIRMLKEIGDVKNIASFIERVKEKKIRLMGFGHRIYKNYDPRATIMRNLCKELFETTGKQDPLFHVAMELEKIAMEDEYFQKRNLYPNVDFYSGIVMRGLDIPEDMFTVIFALGRCVGWLSHWKEMVDEKQMKISRPRQLYLGPKRIITEGNISSMRSDVRSFSEISKWRSLSVTSPSELDAQMAASPSLPFHEIQAIISKSRMPRLQSRRHSILQDAINEEEEEVEYNFDLWGEESLRQAGHVADFSTV